MTIQMAEPTLTVAPPRRKHWLRVFFTGLALFIVTTIVMFVTGNPNLYPTVILIGNFLIPVVFVTLLYDSQKLSELTLPTIGLSFFLGGVLGVLGASVLEPLVIPIPADPNQGLGLSSALMVGVVEEGCKLAAVLVLARRMRHTSEMNGLLLGAAVGMGFAALESTGYAFTALLLSNGRIGASIGETILRGLLAPFNGSFGCLVIEHFGMYTVSVQYLNAGHAHGSPSDSPP